MMWTPDAFARPAKCAMSVALVVGIAYMALGAEPAANTDPAEPRLDGDAAEFVGVYSCLGCHTGDPETSYRDALKRITLEEALTWFHEDKHSLAYRVLDGDLGKDILARLQRKSGENADCLSCHAPGHERRSREPDSKGYTLAEGVACEDCHGAASRWYRPHVRGLKHEELANLGLRDLSDSDVRAERCLDCHVGNAEKQMFVTHEMYAAGHPPLASFDVAAYTASMPPHWRQTVQNDFVNTRMALTGYLAAGARSMKLMSEHYGSIPDLAVLDCDSCHHELSTPSRRGALGSPGRPKFREWPVAMFILAETVVDADGAKSNGSAELEQLRRELQSRPFGTAKAVKEFTFRIADAWTPLAGQLADQTLSTDQVEQLVTSIREEALDVERPPDYDTARSMTWLLQSALTDLGTAVDEVGQPWSTEWKALEDSMGLKLAVQPGPPGPRRPIDYLLPQSVNRPIEKELPAALKLRADYDPKGFQQKLQEFLKEVDKSRERTASARENR